MNAEYLMDGVRVLCERQAEDVWSVWFYIAMMTLVGFIISIAAGIAMSNNGIEFIIIISLLFGLIIGFPFGMILHYFDVEISLPLRYDVTIDETVNFVEFDRQFYVIEQSGEIYTVAYRSDMK